MKAGIICLWLDVESGTGGSSCDRWFPTYVSLFQAIYMSYLHEETKHKQNKREALPMGGGEGGVYSHRDLSRFFPIVSQCALGLCMGESALKKASDLLPHHQRISHLTFSAKCHTLNLMARLVRR